MLSSLQRKFEIELDAQTSGNFNFFANDIYKKLELESLGTPLDLNRSPR